MDEKKLKALAAEVAEGLKTEADLHAFSRMLTKLTVEKALNAELADHPGYEKNAPKTGSNTRNGYSSKTVLCNNSVIRAAIKKRKVFPTDDSVRKVIYLAIKDASKKWSMPIQNWRLAMSRFIIEFGDRLSNHL
ncbi:transposase [Salmonella enterica subsp. enterica]|nr:transposase [Salmonella enterica subsp. enterica serovar Typhimurium]ECF1319597.1 transposase [Salmonella enterica subsp. enterica serovar Typhimurium]ECO1441624.1 transposase [Salmonella enterica subsp. enterica serovar Typhimurium]